MKAACRRIGERIAEDLELIGEAEESRKSSLSNQVFSTTNQMTARRRFDGAPPVGAIAGQLSRPPAPRRRAPHQVQNAEHDDDFV